MPPIKLKRGRWQMGKKLSSKLPWVNSSEKDRLENLQKDLLHEIKVFSIRLPNPIKEKLEKWKKDTGLPMRVIITLLIKEAEKVTFTKKIGEISKLCSMTLEKEQISQRESLFYLSRCANALHMAKYASIQQLKPSEKEAILEVRKCIGEELDNWGYIDPKEEKELVRITFALDSGTAKIFRNWAKSYNYTYSGLSYLLLMGFWHRKPEITFR